MEDRGQMPQLLPDWHFFRPAGRLIAVDPAHLVAAGHPSAGLPDVQLICLAGILVFLAGLASMADAALATVSPARAAEMAREGKRGAAAMAAVASDVVRHLNLLLLLRLICELTALLLALARDRLGLGFWSDLGVTSMFLLWIALCGAALL